jgi:NAD(P)-dependent dehydrogenase (short-subunit alcohol dehydrogenase family)
MSDVHRIEAKEVAFETEVLDLFRTASRDENPLHRAGPVAERSAYGEPVVFGMLVATYAFARLNAENQEGTRRLKLTFLQPAVVGTRYPVTFLSEAKGVAIQVGRFEFPILTGRAEIERPLTSTDESRSSSRYLHSEHDRRLKEPYNPDWAAIYSLIRQVGLPLSGNAIQAVLGMCWCSYLAGERVTGHRTVLLGAHICFEQPRNSFHNLEFSVTTSFVDKDRLVKIFSTLSTEGVLICTAELDVIKYVPVKSLSIPKMKGLLRISDAPDGRLVFITGGGRGLGLALAVAFSFLGCRVITCRRFSDPGATSGCSWPFEQIFVGDCSNHEWCSAAADQVQRDFGLIDILISCAWGPSAPLSSGSCQCSLGDFELLAKIATVPYAAFGFHLEKKHGWSVLISSAMVLGRNSRFSRYIGAKRYAEQYFADATAALTHVSALIVRPPPFHSERTNSGLYRGRTIDVEFVAAIIANRLCEPAQPSTCTVISDFDCAGNNFRQT